MKIQCRTLFDCTQTGVTGTFRLSEIPYQDRGGQAVNNQQDWHRSRNQQRNYETLLQIFGLRTQPQAITQPTCKNGVWEFSFEIESEGVFDVHRSADPLAGLKMDCEGVPMMLNLTEAQTTGPVLITQGAQQNIWFEAINTSTEN
jgi:hypothetical protein